MKKFKLILKIAVPLIIVIAIIFGVVSSVISAKNNQVIDYTYYQELDKHSLSTGFSYDGVVQSKSTQAVYNSLNTLKVEEVYVEVGDVVKKGQVLCKYNLTDVHNNVDSLKENISKLLTNYNSKISNLNEKYSNSEKLRTYKLEQLKKDIDYYTEEYNKSKKDYEYYKKLSEEYKSYSLTADNCYIEMLKFKRSMESTQIEYEKTEISTQNMLDEIQYEIDKEKINNTAITTQNDEYLKIYNKQLENATIVAPCDGVILSVNVEEGFVSDNVVSFLIASGKDLEIKCNINSTNINSLKINDTAVITYTGEKASTEYNGIVTNIDYDENSSTGFTVKISLTDDDVKLLIGMSVSVYFYTNKVEDALAVAYDAIYSDDEEQYYVCVAEENKNGTYEVVNKKVEVGVEGNYYTQIISNEIKTGDKILWADKELRESKIISAEKLKNINEG